MGFAEQRLSAARAAHSATLTNAALVLFGLLYIELTRTGTGEFHHYVHGFSEGLFGQLVLYLGAISLIERSPTDRWTLPILLLVAFAARLVALVHPPFLSTDIYRYVWDGKVQLAGINPFRYIPADAHLAFLRDTAIYPFINRRDYAHTIYPPGAQLLFLLAARLHAGILTMRLVFLSFEAATCWLLILSLRRLGLAAERVVLYAWHPLCIWEIASSGHVDAAAVTFIAAAILASLESSCVNLSLPRRSLTRVSSWRNAPIWLALATLIKLYPLALLPAFLRRRFAGPLLVFSSVVVAGYLPYLSVGRSVFGFLPAYAKEEGIESGARFFPVLLAERYFHVTIAPSLYIVVCALLLAGVAWWAWRQNSQRVVPLCGGLILATSLNLCFSPHYPWYFLWLLPFLALWPWRPAFYMVLAATFLLATRLGAPGEGIFHMNLYLYGGFLLFLAAEWLPRRSPDQLLWFDGRDKPHELRHAIRATMQEEGVSR